MAGDDERQVPEGAAVFPLIPEELGVNPLLLAVLHAIVFVDGSTAEVVDRAAAEEAAHYLAAYLRRLRGRDLQRVREDVETLLGFARQEKWPRDQIAFLRGFLADYGVGEGAES
jgi:hypothetical protein